MSGREGWLGRKSPVAAKKKKKVQKKADNERKKLSRNER